MILERHQEQRLSEKAAASLPVRRRPLCWQTPPAVEDGISTETTSFCPQPRAPRDKSTGGGWSVRAAWAHFWLATDSPSRPTRPPRMTKMRRTPTSDLAMADLLTYAVNDYPPPAPDVSLVRARGYTNADRA